MKSAIRHVTKWGRMSPFGQPATRLAYAAQLKQSGIGFRQVYLARE
ncbi:hypothetical protein L838_0945 [Mycobacterium avium MAV_120709_2344]|nr:hypothetical protein L838_0945 [Mycobacterium avium MAV_120709_2344]